MIEYQTGDILQADAEALVNTVNCVGIMGRGIALQFRKEFPENFEIYKAACAGGNLRPGKMLVYGLRQLHNPRYVINFPTKRHWKGKSRIEDIQSGLAALVEEVQRLNIKSVAVPPLGCGLGGLSWEEVRPLIEAAFRPISEVRVLVYEPAGAPAAEAMPKTKKTPNMTPGRAALLGLMRRYLAAVMDPFVTLLEIHKLMYFMQAAGENLRLGFVKGHYGPYAENLRHLLSHIEGHFISGYGDAEDAPEKQIELNLDASQQAEVFLHDHPETRQHFERVANLIAGFETPYGLELLSTVHWVATQEGTRNPDDIVARVYSWSERKRMFPASHLTLACQVLVEKGWLPRVKPGGEPRH